MMSSPRDPRALKIRGALLYRDRRSQTTSNFQVLSEQLTGWEKLFVPSHWQEIRRSSFDMAWKNKSTRTWGLVWLNLPRILILSRDWSFPKRQEVSKVGQEKLLFDLLWPGRRVRRKMRRRRVTGPGSCPNTDRVFLLPICQKTSYITQQTHSHMWEKFHFLL